MTTSPQRKPKPSTLTDLENSRRAVWRRTFQTIIFYGLLLLVIAAAVPYGEVNSPIQLIFASLIYLLCAGRSIEGLLDGSFAFADKILMAPVIGLLVLTVLQVLPLSLQSAMNGATPDGIGFISLDRYATINFLLVFGSLALTGETLLHLASTRKRLVAIASTVLIVGLGSALFGIGRHAIVGGGDALPIIAIDVAPAQYAQFINRNHFALLMEMTLGVLLGMLLKGRVSTRWKAALWIAVALIWFAIISANSRGGIVSSGGVIVLAVFVHFVTLGSRSGAGETRAADSVARRLKRVLPVAALIALLSGTLVVSVALIGGENTVSRFENADRELATIDGRASRLEIWLSTTRLIAAFPIVGSGFGAYERAITPYDTASGGGQVVRQAHNEYLEITAAGGVVGALLALIFVGLVVRRAVQRFNSRDRLEKAIGFGAALGMSGVILHSFVDFGLHVQINSLVFVLLVVLATAQVKEGRRSRRSPDNQTARRFEAGNK